MSLPPSELVRLETLQRSWQRDRQVASRRLARRWLLWALLRYGLPACMVIGTAAALWVWALPEAQERLVAWLYPPPPPPVIDPSPSALHQAIPDPGELQASPPTPATAPPAPVGETAVPSEIPKTITKEP